MSSRADDFDVRHRGLAADRPGGFGAAGGPDGTGGFPAGSGTVDYDLGYDVGGWDTQGFRSLDAAYRDIEEASHRAGVGVAAPPAAGRPAARGRAPGAHAARHLAAPGGAAPDRGVPGRAAPGRRARGGPVKARGSWWQHWTLRKALGVACGVIGGLIVLAAIAVVVAYEQTPVPTEAMAATGFQQSVVYSGNGSLIGRFGTMDRQMLTYSQLQQSKWLIPAVLAAEDRGFWTEGGISLTGIIRAAYEDVKGSGGSL
ncbi:MAG TPA: transglycosylase domain-containing protein, partial [Streptosporangiaceae bacterium]|nr:transglycosylase domain-containing protein [Streptosporangiaceae bacterium]